MKASVFLFLWCGPLCSVVDTVQAFQRSADSTWRISPTTLFPRLLTGTSGRLSMATAILTDGDDSVRQQYSYYQYCGDNQNHEHMAHFMAYLQHKEAQLQRQAQQAQKRIHQYQMSLQRVRESQRQVAAATVGADTTTTTTSFTETTARSLVKSLIWRIVAGTVTAWTTFQFTHGSWQAVLRIASGDFVSKVLTMLMGERLMNRFAAGRSGTTGGDSVQRSMAKALLWRLFAIGNTLLCALFVAHSDWNIASKIASTDAAVKTLLMFAYERVWARLHWGKEYYLVDATTPLPSAAVVPTSPHPMALWGTQLYEWWQQQQQRRRRRRPQLAYSVVASPLSSTNVTTAFR